MSAANELRLKVAYTLLTVSTAMLLFGIFSHSSWGFFSLFMGSALFVMGLIIFTSLSVINGVPWLAHLLSRHLEPVWHGEIVHTDGSGYKVRYDLDEKGSPWFVAKDVCIAIAVKAPRKDDLMYCGFPVLVFGGHPSFSESNVQAYLTSVAINNHAANRLLVNIRNNMLRKIEKQRDDKVRYG